MWSGNVQDSSCGYYTRIGCITHRTYGGHTVDIWCCESPVEDWLYRSQDIWWTYGVVSDIWCCGGHMVSCVSQWNNGRQSAAKRRVHARTPVPQSKLVLLSVTGGGRASPGAGRQWPWTGWSVWAGRGMEPEMLCDHYMYSPTMSCCYSTILVPAFQALYTVRKRINLTL